MAADMAGCCCCFGFLGKLHHRPAAGDSDGAPSKDLLLPLPRSSDGGSFYDPGDNSSSFLGDDSRSFYEREEEDYLLRQSDGDGDDEPPRKRSEDIILSRARNGFACRDSLVRDTRKLFRSEDETTGCKMINQYVHLGKIGAGSYGKVVKYRNIKDGRLYAIKVLSKHYMLKVRVVRSETAMTDVLREVSLMKMLDHPNIVNLIEVIDDPNTDKFYMVLEYVEGKMVCDNGIGLGEATSRKYLRDIVSGVMYLHSHNIIHGDIKPDNLLVTSTGNVKIGDFSVSQIFEVLP